MKSIKHPIRFVNQNNKKVKVSDIVCKINKLKNLTTILSTKSFDNSIILTSEQAEDIIKIISDERLRLECSEVYVQIK
jgi:hypothetical protein